MADHESDKINTDALKGSLDSCGKETGLVGQIIEVAGAAVGGLIVGAGMGAPIGGTVALHNMKKNTPSQENGHNSLMLGHMLHDTARAIKKTAGHGLAGIAKGIVVGGATGAVAAGVTTNHLINEHNDDVKACKAKAGTPKP